MAVGADDETDFDFQSGFGGHQQRVGRGQSLGRLRVFATRSRACVGDVGELGGAVGSLPNLMFALGQNGWARQWKLYRSTAGNRKRECEKAGPEAKHFGETFQVGRRRIPFAYWPQVWFHMKTNLSTALSAYWRKTRAIYGSECEGDCIFRTRRRRPSRRRTAHDAGLFAAECRVSRLISGGQLRRMGRLTVPRPAVV
jgi:hypothetical protein